MFNYPLKHLYILSYLTYILFAWNVFSGAPMILKKKEHPIEHIFNTNINIQ